MALSKSRAATLMNEECARNEKDTYRYLVKVIFKIIIAVYDVLFALAPWQRV